MSEKIYNDIRDAIKRYRNELLSAFDSNVIDKESMIAFLNFYLPLPEDIPPWNVQLMSRTPDIIKDLSEGNI